MATDTAVLNKLVEIAPGILADRYRSTHCIAAVRHGLAVLGYFGIRARPQKMQTIAANQAWADWMATRTDPHETPPTDDIWAVAIDLDNHGGGYPGHLVLIVDVDGVDHILDLNSGQFSRPERGLPVADAMLLPLLPGWEAGDWQTWGDGTGVRVMHRALPERDWTHAPDWKRKPPYAGLIIRRVRTELS